MIGGKKYFAILEGRKWLNMLLLKRQRKIEMDAFYPSSEQGGLCPVLPPALTSLHNISFSFEVNAAITSIFFPLHHVFVKILL